MCIYLRNWQVTLSLYTLGVLFSEYTAKASIEPRDYRVVFLTQKKPQSFDCGFHPAGTEGLEPSTFGFGDQRSTN